MIALLIFEYIGPLILSQMHTKAFQHTAVSSFPIARYNEADCKGIKHMI